MCGSLFPSYCQDQVFLYKASLRGPPEVHSLAAYCTQNLTNTSVPIWFAGFCETQINAMNAFRDEIITGFVGLLSITL